MTVQRRLILASLPYGLRGFNGEKANKLPIPLRDGKRLCLESNAEITSSGFIIKLTGILLKWRPPARPFPSELPCLNVALNFHWSTTLSCIIYLKSTFENVFQSRPQTSVHDGCATLNGGLGRHHLHSPSTVSASTGLLDTSAETDNVSTI